MSNFLRKQVFAFLALVILQASFTTAFGQVGCGGFNGSIQPNGGPTSSSDGDYCLNLVNPAPAVLQMVVSNVADGSNPNNFGFVVNWDDGSALETFAFGDGKATYVNTGPHAYQITNIRHRFLPKPCNATPGRQCAYKPRFFLRIAGVTCTAEFGNPPDFFRMNTENTCPGEMRFTETVSNDNIFEVCAGTNPTVTFTDRTVLNCLPPQENSIANSYRRWRRISYGVAGSNIAGVQVNGAVQTYPFNASSVPLASTEPRNTSATPFGTNTTLPITIPTTATPGQEFRVRIEYWNYCNKYDDGVGAPPVNGDNPPVILDGIIRIVAKPTAPTGVNQVVCSGTNPLPTFRINFAAASSQVLWYRDNAGVPGAAITNPNGGNNKDLPASAFPGGINSTTPGVYRVWASYQAVASVDGLICESDRIPITLTIRETLTAPAITGLDQVCNNNAAPVAYTVPITAAATPFGGATFYEWDVVTTGDVPVADVTISPQADGVTLNATFSISNATFGAATSVVRKIRLRRRYTTDTTFPGGSRCSSSRREILVTIYRNTDDGSISAGGTFCEGADLGNITWTPGVGAIQRWELSSNGGPFNTIPSFGTSNPVSATTLGLGSGTHNIRAIIQNGTCVSDPTDNVTYTITVNPDVSDAGPPQSLCVLAPGLLQTTLNGNTPGGAVTSSTWTVENAPAGALVNFANATFEDTQVTVDRPGNYTFRWTLNAGLCSSVDDVVISFGREPSQPTATAIDVCGLIGGTLNAAVPPVNNEDVEWTLVAGPGTVNFNGTENSLPAMVDASVLGTYTFELTYSSGSCTPRTDQVTLTFGQAVTSLPEANKTVCLDDVLLAPIQLTGSISGGGNNGGNGLGHWRIQGGTGSGTFTSSGTATGSSTAGVSDFYQPVVGDYANASIIFELVAEGNICPDVAATVTVTYDKRPDAAAAGADFAVCGTSATLAGTAATDGGSGVWSVVTAGPAVTVPGTHNSSVTGLVTGVNTFEWTISSALGVCTPTSDQITITRNADPAVNNIAVTDLCESVANTNVTTSVDLTSYNASITAATNTVRWFRDAPRTDEILTPTAEDVADAEAFFIRVTNTSTPACSSDGLVTFTINQKPFVSNLTKKFCEETPSGGTRSDIDLTDYDDEVGLGAPNRTIAWFTDAAHTSAVPTPTDIDNVTNDQEVFAIVTNTISSCVNDATITFKINPIPVDNPIVGTENICYDAAEVHFYNVQAFNPNSDYQWTLPPNVTVVSGGVNDFYVALQFLPGAVGNTLNLSVIEVSGEGCVGPPQAKPISVEGGFQTLTINADTDPICDSDANVTFSTTDFGYTYLWTVPPGATITSGQGSAAITVNMGSVSGNVTVTPNTSFCTGSDATLPVTIAPRPVLFIDPAGYIVCSGAPTDVQLSVAGGSVPAILYNVTARVEAPGLSNNGLPAIPPALPGDADVIRNDEFRNLTGGILGVNYTIVPESAQGCEGAPRILTVNVRPEPQLDPGLGKQVCSDEDLNVLLRTAPGKASADNYVITAIDLNGAVRSGGTSTIGVPLLQDGILEDAWTNTQSASITVSYHIIPQDVINVSTTCVGDNLQVDFIVNPEPVLAATPPNPVVCSQTPTDITLSSTNIPADFSWTIDAVGPNIQGARAGSAALSNQAFINDLLTNASFTTAEQVVYRVVATSADNCSVDPLLLAITVNPVPAVDPSVELAACPDPNNPGSAVTDLTALDDDLANPVNTNVEWFSIDPSPGNVPAIPNATTFQIQNGVTIYAEVSSTIFSEPDGAGSRACRTVVPIVPVIYPEVQFTPTPTDESCSENNDGRVEFIVTSGTSPFTAQMNAEPPLASSGTFIFGNLQAGTYTFVVTDKNNCQATETATIQEPSALGFISITAEDADCFYDASAAPPNGQPTRDRNGLVIAVVQGGSGQYDFEISPPSPPIPADPGDPVVPVGGFLFKGLRPGNYTVKVTDQNLPCFIQSTTVEIDVPDPIVLTPLAKEDLSCFGSNDGSVSTTATGGLGDLTYTLIPNSQANQTQTLPAGTLVTFAGLTSDIYQMEVTDANGCRTSRSSVIIPDLTDLSPGAVGNDQNVCVLDANGNPVAPEAFKELVPPFGSTGAYEFLWQFSTNGTATPVGTPLDGDPNWSAVPGGTTNVIDPATTLVKSIPAMYYRRLVRSVPSKPNPPAFCLTYKFDKVVIINNRPNPEVQIGGSDFVVCEGQDEFIRLDLLGVGTPPLKYNVFDGDITSPGTGSISYKIRNPELSPTVGFTQIVDNFGCSAPDQLVPISVTRKPDVDIPPGTFCADQSIMFTHNIDPLADALTEYFWDFGDGSPLEGPYMAADHPSGVVNIAHSFPAGSTSGNTNYFVKLTAIGTCPDFFTEAQITINPTIARNIIEPNDQVCAGETITFTDNTRGAAAATWTWKWVENGTPMQQSFVHPTGGTVSFPALPFNPTAQNPIEYLIEYTAVNPSAPACASMETLGPIMVYQQPVAAFTHDPAAPQMVGGVVDLEYTINNFNDVDFDYSWVDVGQEIISDQSNAAGDIRTVQYGEDKPIDVTLFVVNSGYTECNDTERKIITINPTNPSIGFNATPLAACFPITVTTENISASYDRFEWTLFSTNGTSEVTTLRQPQFRLTQPGTYTLTMVASKSGTNLAEVAPPKTIHVLDRPIADFLLRTKQAYIGQAVEPINTSFNADSYLWDFDDGTTSEEFQPRHFYELEGKDSIMLVASRNHGQFDIDGDGVPDEFIFCRDTTKQAIHIIAGGALKIPNAFTPNVSGANSGHEDPNFTNDVFLPIMEGVEEFTMQIFDRWGTLVFESRDKNMGWNGYDRNGRLMPAGVYVYKLVMRLGDGQRTTQVGDVTLIR
jgi:gliding motility-associated-like protein